jgi:carbonic anhydrase/acetyltransferase-like protein (isoleucine patch superfamily)
MQYDTQFHPEQIAPTVFVAPNVTILGNVSIAADSSVWFGSVLRGDTEEINIGRETNIQDLSMLHADLDFPCVLGDRVTIGHQATIHGAVVEEETMIGMRAILRNGCKIGTGSIVAAGTLVPEGMEIPPGHLVMGVPAKIRRPTEPEEAEWIRKVAAHYVEAAQAFGNTEAGQLI